MIKSSYIRFIPLLLNCTVSEKSLDPAFPFVFLEAIKHFRTLPFSFTETGVFSDIISVCGCHFAFCTSSTWKAFYTSCCLAEPYISILKFQMEVTTLLAIIFWKSEPTCVNNKVACKMKELTSKIGQMSFINSLAGREEHGCPYYWVNTIQHKVQSCIT